MRAGDRGTEMTINGARRGLIEGDDFNGALLAVWRGSEPVSDGLKNAMVGVDNE